MVVIRIPQLLKERNLSPTDLMYGARLASGTAYKLSNEDECQRLKGIRFDVLVRICKYLNVGICDVLELENGSRLVVPGK